MKKHCMPAFLRYALMILMIAAIFFTGYANYAFAHYLEPSVIERAKQATVGVLSPYQQKYETITRPRFDFRGTGVHIGDGFIITARHVAEMEDAGEKVIRRTISVVTTNLYQLNADLVGENEMTDIAVYRIIIGSRPHLTAAVPFAKLEPASGEDVFTFGFPLNWGLTVKFGHLGNTNAYTNTSKTKLFQLDLQECSGDSGGGVFNEKGELVGIMHAIIQVENVQGIGGCGRFSFAVPLKLVQRVTLQLLEGRRPMFSVLGIRMEAILLGERWAVGVQSAEGPALAGGIKKDDIILAINNIEIADAAQLKSFIVENTKPGDKVFIRVLRKGKELLITVTTGEG